MLDMPNTDSTINATSKRSPETSTGSNGDCNAGCPAESRVEKMTTATKKAAEKKAPAKKSDKAAKPQTKGKKESKPVAAAKPAVEVKRVVPLKSAKPKPHGQVVLEIGKDKIGPLPAFCGVILSCLQEAGVGAPTGKLDLIRTVARAFVGAPGTGSGKDAFTSGANGDYNKSIVVLQSHGLCDRVEASSVIEGGRGKVALLTAKGAKVRIPDACRIGK